MRMYAAATGRGRTSSLPADTKTFLHSVRLRTTPRRIVLANLLLKNARWPVTAEILYEKARAKDCFVSRTAVCNNLRHFEQAGLLRRITVSQSKKAWFVIANANFV